MHGARCRLIPMAVAPQALKEQVWEGKQTVIQ